MRIMSLEQEKLLAELVNLAEGDIQLVEEALVSSKPDGSGHITVETVIDYILENTPRHQHPTNRVAAG